MGTYFLQLNKLLWGKGKIFDFRTIQFVSWIIFSTSSGRQTITNLPSTPCYRSLSFPSMAFSNICTECVRVRSHLSTAEVIRRKCRNIREDGFRLSYYSMAWEILNNSARDWGEEQWGRGKLLSSGISIYHIISQFSKGAWLYCI